MKDAWALHVFARDRLLFPGGPVNRLFPWTGSITGNNTNALYQSGEASPFQSNYFHNSLKKRGLIKTAFGPPLKHFPFYENAPITHNSIRKFMPALVKPYYPTAEDVKADTEL